MTVYILCHGEYSSQEIEYYTTSLEVALAWDKALPSNWYQEADEYNTVLRPHESYRKYFKVVFRHCLDTNKTKQVVPTSIYKYTKRQNEMVIRNKTDEGKTYTVTAYGKTEKEAIKIAYDKISHQRAIDLGVFV